MKAMNRNLALTGSLGLGASLLGASLMYIFDPRSREVPTGLGS